MYLHNCLLFLPWVLPWSNAYTSLNSGSLSSHLIDPYLSMSAQRLVTLTGLSPATFATENSTTKSVPPNEKNQALDAETTKLAKLTLQDTSPCPEQEDLDCEECGGQKYDNEEGTYRCLGAEKDGFKWKDCFCLGESTQKVFPYEPQSPTPEEIAAEYERLGFAKESASRT